MNTRGSLLLLSLLGGLAVSVSAATAPPAAVDAVPAPQVAPAGNPYSALVGRNMFGLVPIPVHDPALDVQGPPPPKITPNGIMTIFGKLQVLFKVAQPAAGGQPAKDLSYMLCEGERQDDIEVQKIDESAATITFNNHGTVQTLELVKVAPGAAGGTPGGVPGGGLRPPGMAPVTHPAGGVGAGPVGAGGRFGRNRATNPAANQGGAADAGVGAAGLGAGGMGGGNANSDGAEQLSPEAQVIMIEANRMATQDLVNKGLYPPLPPTVLTPEDATAVDGAPLIAPNEPVDPAPKK